MKQCTNCQTLKPEMDFYAAPNGRTLDGRHSQCKECMREKERIRYHSDPNKQRSRMSKRDRAASQSSYDYIKHAAKAAVRRAVLRGTIIKPTRCSQCGVECDPQGHHDDHKKKLAVMWLCRPCHAKRHLQLGRIKVCPGHPNYEEYQANGL